MGREANCACEWNGTTSQVKALLESRPQKNGRVILRYAPVVG